jgi:hypothetical protein
MKITHMQHDEDWDAWKRNKLQLYLRISDE